MRHRQQVAVVTDDDRDLGVETARQLAMHGYRVVFVRSSPERGAEAAEALETEGLSVLEHPVDTTDPGSVAAFASLLGSEFGCIDVLVNSAGVHVDAPGESIVNVPIERVRAGLEANFFGTLRMIQAIVPLMEPGGRIVNVSSSLAQLSGMEQGTPSYRIAKAAVNALTRILADELHERGILVNSVCPGSAGTGAERAGRPDVGGVGARDVDTIVWAATLSEDGPTGGFFRDHLPIDW